MPENKDALTDWRLYLMLLLMVKLDHDVSQLRTVQPRHWRNLGIIPTDQVVYTCMYNIPGKVEHIRIVDLIILGKSIQTCIRE